MKKQILKISAILFLSIAFLASCKKDRDQVVPITETNNQTVPAEKIVLGKQLENPYLLSNMNMAYSNITNASNARITRDSSPVRVTHLYLRFLPKDWDEYDVLKSDTTLKLYQIPLDYEIATFGNTYQDPSIAEGNPTWQYVAIKQDYAFNKNIQYEILAELYIPELDNTLASSTANQRIAGKSFVEALVNEAMILTKNYSDTITTNLSFARTTFNPNGTVRVFDTRLNKLVPLQGVKMRARRWFDVREATTDANGWYQTSGFKNAANYSLIFETGGFDVRTGTFGQATIDGPKQSSSWNVDLWDGTNRFYAHVFRGAWRYFYGNIGGLSRPKSVQDVGTLFKQKLKYSAMDKGGKSQGLNIGNWSFWGANPNIYIYRYKDNGGEYASDEIFSTTCHETCHTTHWQVMNLGIIQYGQINDFIAESWPVAVEWYITSLEYRSRGIANYGSETYSIPASYPLDRAYQYWTKSTSADYTPIFIDLVDSFNQSSSYFSTPNDQVTGYTLAGIESNFLKHVYGQTSLRDQLKNYKPAGVTDSQIDLLLSSY
jgi:hypothetical protein